MLFKGKQVLYLGDQYLDSCLLSSLDRQFSGRRFNSSEVGIARFAESTVGNRDVLCTNESAVHEAKYHPPQFSPLSRYSIHLENVKELSNLAPNAYPKNAVPYFKSPSVVLPGV